MPAATADDGAPETAFRSDVAVAAELPSAAAAAARASSAMVRVGDIRTELPAAAVFAGAATLRIAAAAAANPSVLLGFTCL